MRSILSLCTVLVLALAISGCRPNEADLKAQEEAMAAQDAAKAAEADIYAADTYRSATSTIDDANSNFEQKEHDEATAGYMQAKDLFDRAKAEAETRKTEISAETQMIIDRVMLGISDTRGSLGEAPRGKGADDDLDQLNADLNQPKPMRAMRAATSTAGNTMTHSPVHKIQKPSCLRFRVLSRWLSRRSKTGKNRTNHGICVCNPLPIVAQNTKTEACKKRLGFAISGTYPMPATNERIKSLPHFAKGS